MFYFLFGVCFLIVTAWAYKLQKIKQQEQFGISKAVNLASIPKLNPQLGLEVLAKLNERSAVTYEQGLVVLLTANIPLDIARQALVNEGLEISVETIKARLRNPFVVNLRT